MIGLLGDNRLKRKSMLKGGVRCIVGYDSISASGPIKPCLGYSQCQCSANPSYAAMYQRTNPVIHFGLPQNSGWVKCSIPNGVHIRGGLPETLC